MATPPSDGTDQSSGVENSPQESAAGGTVPAAPPRRGGRSFVSRLFFSILALLILLGIAGYGALVFRDADPNVGLAANYVEQGLAETQALLDKAQETLADLMGTPKPASKAASRRALLDKAPLSPPPPAPEPAAPPLEAAPEPAAPAQAEAPAEPEKPAAAPPSAAESPSEPARKTPPEIAREAAPAAPPAAPPAPPPVAAEPAKPEEAPAARTETRDADGFTDRDLIAALEGRIEALSDEVRTLRDKLDAPKNETRAEPEMEAPKSAPAVADAAAANVVLAFALQRRLDGGRPFAEEIAAISRLGADPAPAPILIETAEKGVATAAQLRESFAAIAKKLRSHENHAEGAHDGGALAEHLLQGASKLVKVRPTGQAAHPDSLDGKLERVDAALAHDDFAGAEAAFEALPEEARIEAKAFGDALRQRNEASRAADEFLHGAVAALGVKK